jgi:thioredoxin 1
MTRTFILLLLGTLLLVPGCARKPSKTVALTTSTFKETVLKSKLPVLVDFWFEGCKYCGDMDPVIRELADSFEGKAVVAKVNNDQYPEIAAAFGIQGFPTFLVFKDGALKQKFVGVTPKESLSNLLTALQ